MLSLKNLTVSIKDKKILNSINLDLEKGKIYAIMGPNGCGKSTLANAILGHPSYEIHEESKIVFNQKDINKLTTDKRVNEGLFLTFQTPLALTGVSIFELLKQAQPNKELHKISEEVHNYAKELKVNEELLFRSLNQNASGGERKKLELLQAAVLKPKLIIFDEIDTGVDVDALKDIASFMNKYQKDTTYVIITHYNRILKHVNPDKVIVLENGKITRQGKANLAIEIEDKGYGNN
ncbi:Fe-S cluster assembly ATPase SufC [candidate division CPR3 bacterium GWF2_35_18]|nr:MAG: Fe-S cluster assembly ATPase SufC [candidate division CPR3 bacterium GWF2_35_18]OGB64893.1 MAG: Fe-S cluster assembly ATPase SufC [candidate division CPR3 bacterium RIFOXYA2_FULL_35_13]OGB75827.1 MAG: Fe-S cluster assembly ATPase SufC [candidate division CPR3 bacterium RIFOXYC2_FULL_35_7]OGB78589.1 MAG: Fe-S cluster assembly ATPase SufC [candidate division CPR3 bacterium RIFOXYB2_FULL_35_8]OGB79945.1 MAG: Fe-S cluster assembly ATPase SufC [candidate division CPR3 bacterium GWE2_35_7]